MTDFSHHYCFKMRTPDATSSSMTGDGIDGRRTCVRTFRDAEDIYSIFSDDDSPEESDYLAKFFARRTCLDCELRLSTVASLSSRFPVISPHANLRNTNGVVMDRVVDGGYFENYGALAALELAEMITRIARDKGDNTLVPMVIVVTNEPNASRHKCTTTGTEIAGSGSNSSIAQFTPLSFLGLPILTFTKTRSARGRHAARQLCSRLAHIWAQAAPTAGQSALSQQIFGLRQLGHFFVEIGVDNANRPDEGISMNWWLSKHTQEVLDKAVRPEWVGGEGDQFSDYGSIRTVLSVLDPVRLKKEVASEQLDKRN